MNSELIRQALLQSLSAPELDFDEDGDELNWTSPEPVRDSSFDRMYSEMAIQLGQAFEEREHYADEVVKLREALREATQQRLQESRNNIEASQKSLQSMMLLALYMAEQQAQATSLARQASDTIAQVRAFISDEPEPQTMRMLEDLEAAVARVTRKPSQEILDLLDEMGIGEDEPAPVKKRRTKS